MPTVGRLFINNFYNIGRDSVMGYSSLGNTLDSKRYLFSTDRRNVALKIPTITASDETVQVLSSGGKPSNIFDKPIIDARNFAHESSVSSSISSAKKVSTFRGIWNFLSWLFAAKQPDARTQLNDAHTNKIGASPTATNGRKQDPRRKSFELSYRQKLIDDGKSAYHPIILQCFEHFRFVTEKSATLIDKNKKYLQLAGKSVVGIWIGMKLIALSVISARNLL